MCTYLYTDFCQSVVRSFRGQWEGSVTFLELLGGLVGGNRPQKLEKALRGRDAVLADGVRQVYTEEVKMRGSGWGTTVCTGGGPGQSACGKGSFS